MYTVRRLNWSMYGCITATPHVYVTEKITSILFINQNYNFQLLFNIIMKGNAIHLSLCLTWSVDTINVLTFFFFAFRLPLLPLLSKRYHHHRHHVTYSISKHFRVCVISCYSTGLAEHFDGVVKYSKCCRIVFVYKSWVEQKWKKILNHRPTRRLLLLSGSQWTPWEYVMWSWA